jgi:5-methylcytosine-specific restriction endonuclease McrA
VPNAWFRLYSEFADDPKVQMMPEHMQRRLIMLFCSRCKDETLSNEELAFAWRVSEDAVLETKALFIARGFVDEHWNLLNWDKRQYVSDNSNDRVKRYRDRRAASGMKRGSGHIPAATIIHRYGNRCVYCESQLHLCIDHVLPVQRGGTDDERNLVSACKRCNSGKSGRTPEEAGYSFKNRDAELRYRDYLRCNGYSNATRTDTEQTQNRTEKDPAREPSMIARFVCEDLSLSGQDLLRNLTDICRAEMSKSIPPEIVRETLVAAWREYATAGESGKFDAKFMRQPAKFFGDGDWRNQNKWPWKAGASRKAVAPSHDPLEEIWRQNGGANARN